MFIKYWCYSRKTDRQNPRVDHATVVAILLCELDAATGDAVGDGAGASVSSISSCGACDGAGVSGPCVGATVGA